MLRAHRYHRYLYLTPLYISTLFLSACGGGNDTGTATLAATDTSLSVTAPAQISVNLAQEPGAPQFTGNTAIDGFNWFNFRRRQMGVPALASNSVIDQASQSHSDYQKLNGLITHEQIAGKPGFSGVVLLDRLQAANYPLAATASYAYGEVISAMSDTSGFNAAEKLITAIYHRYAIFEPVFKEAGVGAATVAGGYTYFTTDFAANNGFGSGLGPGKYAVYPTAGQQRVPPNFYSDTELPDPVASRNEVGFPISIHADIDATISVKNFSVQARGGTPLASQLMTSTRDPETPTSAAAIIPLAALSPATTYDVQFSGVIDGASVSRNWSFTTR